MMMSFFGALRLAQQNFLKISSVHYVIKNAGFKRLSEVGRLTAPKLTGNYEAGQLFLHKVFGYRGVILFPWLTRVYEGDIPNVRNTLFYKALHMESYFLLNFLYPHYFPEPPEKEKPKFENVKPETPSGAASKEVKSRTHPFYQVLIDVRDCPFIRAQTDGVTFLRSQGSRCSFYAIPGLDYVDHDDILPYDTTEKWPLYHELVDKLLKHQPDKDPPFTPQAALQTWEKTYQPWLALSNVHKETTENVRVTVIPFYMGCQHSKKTSKYWWRYCIRLENLGGMSIQLRTRKFTILRPNGTIETQRRGVLGQEPVLSREMPALQYSSHVSLQTSSGLMWGTFQMEREDGSTFDCGIPQFHLQSKGEESSSLAPTVTE